MRVETLSIEEKLSAAFMLASARRPYFSQGLAFLVRRMAKIPSATMAVTRDGVLLVDPRFVAKYECRQLGEVLVHELLHLLRDHPRRADAVALVDRSRWNVAADCEINCGLDAEFLPDKPCLPWSFGMKPGKLAEEYYDLLPEEIMVDRWVGCGACGSGSGGERVDGEPDLGSGEGRTEVELSRMRREVAADVAGSRAGSCPGDLLRWAHDLLRPPKIRWQDRLRRAIRAGVAGRAGRSDYVRTRTDRRQACYDQVARSLGAESFLAPALRGRVPRVAVGVDTSGSMGEAELVAAMSEVEGVLRVVGAPVVFLACDCAISERPRQICSSKEAVRMLRGGGGTDFAVVMEEVGRMRPLPGLFIFLTDGCGPAPKTPPKGVSVLWVLVGKDPQRPASWGESVVVEVD